MALISSLGEQPVKPANSYLVLIHIPVPLLDAFLPGQFVSISAFDPSRPIAYGSPLFFD